jgi:hypothetical protein
MTKPKLKLVRKDNASSETPLILSPEEAKKRFLLYSLLKLGGLAALFGGVFLGQSGVTPVSVVLLLAGAGSLFIRPKMLGLTTKR